jgi:hypothetical protein
MALVGFGYQIVRYELALVSFSHALAYCGSLLVRHRVDAGSPRLDFARIFGEFVLILAGPGFSVGKEVAERFGHHSFHNFCLYQRLGTTFATPTDPIHPLDTVR